MTSRSAAWLTEVLASEWVIDAAASPCRPVMAGPDQIRFGSITVPLHCLTNVQPALHASPITVVHDGWKVSLLRTYRPLLYYAAFGSPDIFACLRLAIESALTFGQWRHEILVLTSSAQVITVETTLAPLGLGHRLHVAAVPGEDVLDWCCARYRLDASPIFQVAQPLLYLDTDIVCDQPIDGLMTALMQSDRIQVRSEGRLDEGEPETNGHWFGWRLLAADNVPFDPVAPGFSSGAIGFASAAVAQDSFAAILASVYGHAAVTSSRHTFAGYDQPFANYVLRKRDRFATALLDPLLRLHRADADDVATPFASAATGLVHFTAGVGLAAPKRAAMARYLKALNLAG